MKLRIKDHESVKKKRNEDDKTQSGIKQQMGTIEDALHS